MYSYVNGRNDRSKTLFYNPMHGPFAGYCTEALQKSEMKLDYENEIFLNNLHLIPDPLQKNLADTLITSDIPEKVNKKSLNTPTMPPQQEVHTNEVRPESALAGITNFFSGMFSMLSGAMFRTKSPVDYYDCFDADSRQGSPRWQRANADEQDKNGLAADKSSYVVPTPNVCTDMNTCKTKVSSCEEKLNQVKCLLTPNQPKQASAWTRKRPKKVFVEPGAVEDSFEDAFAPEDFVPISSEPFIEYCSPPQFETVPLCQTDAPKTKVELAPIIETTEIVTEVKNALNSDIKTDSDQNTVNLECVQLNLENKNTEDNAETVPENISTENPDDKLIVISSCEDKLTKLKELLQDKRKKQINIVEPTPLPTPEHPKPAKTIPISKPVDKHHKNPHRMLDKRCKMKMKRSIQEDAVFANEIAVESPTDASPSTPSTINSSETSLGEYFDELKGRFRSTSATESEDSFQIVFHDSPKQLRASDCESEDSFIVFEDDCYTSNDVFGDSDSESDVSDSGCSTMTCKLSHSLSRTVSNLTDDTLYESSDEVDCAKVEPVEARGLLMDASKKKLREDQPAKKVHFSTEPPQVKVMRVWAYAARQARAGHWERYALDRDRFKRRIADLDMALSWVLKPQHRSRVMFQRFMPWWNRERRRELAERKERAAEEKRIEEERVEEERRAEESVRAANDKKIIEEENSVKSAVNDVKKSIEEYRKNKAVKNKAKKTVKKKTIVDNSNAEKVNETPEDVQKVTNSAKCDVNVKIVNDDGKIRNGGNIEVDKVDNALGVVGSGKCS